MTDFWVANKINHLRVFRRLVYNDERRRVGNQKKKWAKKFFRPICLLTKRYRYRLKK